MAYATIAGLPVQVGLYTAFLPMLVYAVLGTSSVLSVSTTTTLAILTGADLAEAAPGGDPAALLRAAATLTLLVGAILVAAWILRLGFVANFISEPVLVGFKAGIGVVIVLDQVPKLLGFHVSGPNFLAKLRATVAHLPETSLPTLAVAAAMIAILVGFERFLPQRAGAARRRRGRNRRRRPPGPQGARHRARGAHPDGVPSAHHARLLAGPGALVGRDRHRLDVLHRDRRRRARLRAERRARAARQPRAARDRARQRGRRLSRRDAVGRRHEPDGGQPARGRPHAARGDRHRGRHARDDVLPGSLHRPHAAGDARRGRRRLLDRAHQARGVPLDPAHPADGVRLGARRVRGRHALRDAQGNPRRHHPVARGPGAPGGESARPRPPAQARHERLSAGLERASRGRGLPRTAARCGRRVASSSPTRNASGRRCRHSSPSRNRESWPST